MTYKWLGGKKGGKGHRMKIYKIRYLGKDRAPKEVEQGDCHFLPNYDTQMSVPSVAFVSHAQITLAF